MTPRILVWADYLCPFCYIGTACGRDLEERYGAEIDWLPFDLHPDYPPEGITAGQLAARFGPAVVERTTEMLRGHGLPVAERRDIVPNTLKALRLAELARARGLHGELHPRLFGAYWARGLDLGSDDVLLAEAAAVGLDRDDAREVLLTDRFADTVRFETQRAHEAGITGVPAWVIDERVLVPGAQSPEVFDRVMAKLGHEPLTNLTGTA